MNARRKFLKTMAYAASAAVLTPVIRKVEAACALNERAGVPGKDVNVKNIVIPNPIVPIELSDAEWKQKLSPEAYQVLRKEGTEPPSCSPLDHETRHGAYFCAGCDLPLFSSDNKFDSGTGWPSFYQPIDPRVIAQHTDYKLIYPRSEVHCARCGGHLGHVFEDGPKPTGLRYCMNGIAMVFRPTA